MPEKPLLPDVPTVEAYRPLRGDPQVWLPAVRAICQREGLGTDHIYAEQTGTNPVFRIGKDTWLKLIPPLWRKDFEREHCALAALAGTAAIPATPLRGTGEIEGWPYLVLGSAEGRSIGRVWGGLGREAQADLGAQIGSLAARLHAQPTDGLEALDHEWPAFMARRRERCVASHAAHGADETWQRQIHEFLESVPEPDAPDVEPVFLHADLTDEHLLVSERGGRWVLTGVIDFADAMLGAPLYDFAAPAVFLTQRHPWGQRALLTGYGFGEADLTDALARRLTGYALLHRFSRLRDLLRFCPEPAPRNMDELHAALWSLV